jgi:hypothetical protein
MHVLQDEQPGNQPRRRRRLTSTGLADAGKTPVEKLPIDLACQPH